MGILGLRLESRFNGRRRAWAGAESYVAVTRHTHTGTVDSSQLTGCQSGVTHTSARAPSRLSVRASTNLPLLR